MSHFKNIDLMRTPIFLLFSSWFFLCKNKCLYFLLFKTHVIDCVNSLVFKGEDEEILSAVAVSKNTSVYVGY